MSTTLQDIADRVAPVLATSTNEKSLKIDCGADGIMVLDRQEVAMEDRYQMTPFTAASIAVAGFGFGMKFSLMLALLRQRFISKDSGRRAQTSPRFLITPP